jgi:aminoglycoside phosphotransferase (APT) family kinase protein
MASTPAPVGDALDEKVRAWLEGNMGRVVTLDRHPRWRPGWNAVVERAGEQVPLYVRGPRGDTYVSPVSMVQEAAIHRAFEANDIPAPRIYGMIDDPFSIVMEMLPGRIDTSVIADEAQRQRVRDSFVDTVARVHSLTPEAFAETGLRVPHTPEEIALNLYQPSEHIFYKLMKGRPFPLMEFIASWLHRNVPQDRTRAAFVNFDGGQFLYDETGFTGLIDFEVSTFGDPAGEFAGMRLRDTSEPLGDLTAMIERYERQTGDRISRKLIEYHTAGFCGVNGLLMWPLMFESSSEQDYVAYMAYSVVTSRWSIRAIADFLGIALVDPPEPVRRPVSFSQAGRHLVRHIEAMRGGTPAADYARDSAAGQALYLSRANDYGLDVLSQSLADIAALTGERHDDWDAAQAALSAWVARAGPEDDARLAQHFHNWLCRQEFIVRGCGAGAFMVGLNLQPIRDH